MLKGIASLLASGTEILYGLGLGERVVAVSHECDYPEEVRGKPRVTFTEIDIDAPSGEIDRQVKNLTSKGAALYRIDVEKLASLRPSLIVTQSHCDVCAVSYDEVCAAVREHESLREATVVDVNPQRLHDLDADIMRIGEAAGVAARARTYVDALHARLTVVTDQTAAIPSECRPRTICIEWIDPIMVAANWMPDLIERAGGHNGLTQAGQPSRYTAWEDVCTFDPQVIVSAPCGFGLPRALHESRVLCDLPGWNELTAVKTGRVYALDGNAYFNRSGPRLVDSVEILASVLHPDRFGAADERFPHAAARL